MYSKRKKISTCIPSPHANAIKSLRIYCEGLPGSRQGCEGEGKGESVHLGRLECCLKRSPKGIKGKCEEVTGRQKLIDRHKLTYVCVRERVRNIPHTARCSLTSVLLMLGVEQLLQQGLVGRWSCITPHPSLVELIGGVSGWLATLLDTVVHLRKPNKRKRQMLPSVRNAVYLTSCEISHTLSTARIEISRTRALS